MASTSFLPAIFLDNSFSSFWPLKIDLAFLKIDLASPNLTVIVHSVQGICPKVTGGLSSLYLVDLMKCFFIWMVKVCMWIGGSSIFLLLVKFCQKEKLKTIFGRRNDFLKFSVTRGEKKIFKSSNSYIWFFIV